MTNPHLLEGFELETEWSKQHNVSPRTTQRYRLRDGLPWAQFGGRVYIDTRGAQEWFAKRVKGSNPGPLRQSAKRA
jgi:hypothetical protein